MNVLFLRCIVEINLLTYLLTYLISFLLQWRTDITGGGRYKGNGHDRGTDMSGETDMVGHPSSNNDMPIVSVSTPSPVLMRMTVLARFTTLDCFTCYSCCTARSMSMYGNH